MAEALHIPVLLEECIRYLKPCSPGVYVDGWLLPRTAGLSALTGMRALCAGHGRGWLFLAIDFISSGEILLSWRLA